VRHVGWPQVDPFDYQRTRVGSICGPLGGARANILRRRCRGIAQCNSARHRELIGLNDGGLALESEGAADEVERLVGPTEHVESRPEILRRPAY